MLLPNRWLVGWLVGWLVVVGELRSSVVVVELSVSGLDIGGHIWEGVVVVVLSVIINVEWVLL